MQLITVQFKRRIVKRHTFYRAIDLSKFNDKSFAIAIQKIRTGVLKALALKGGNMKKVYEVTRYQRHSVFDKNEFLVWRWYKIEKFYFNNKTNALRFFTACNYLSSEKAVLRIKRGGKKHVKR